MKFFFKYKYVGLFLVVTSIASSCKKLVDVEPPLTSVTSKAVFSDDILATSMITGLYVQISNATPIQGGSIVSINTVTGLSSDELSVLPGLVGPFQNAFRNEITNVVGENGLSGSPFTWGGLYSIANGATVAIEGLSEQATKETDISSNLSSGVKRQLLGEARFLRAFSYFYLINLFGDVPLVLSSDVSETANLSRTPKAKVYEQIVTDLLEAKTSLNTNFLANDLVSVSSERLRPTRWAAIALLARVYLYTKQYDQAEINSSEVIGNVQNFELTTLDQAFLKNTKEAIWQLQPVTNNWDTSLGRYFILNGAPTTFNMNKPFFLNPELVNSFEIGDGRKTRWISSIIPPLATTTYYYPFKYKRGIAPNTNINSNTIPDSFTEYMTVLRIAEQYLIRAEARLKQNNSIGAVNDINAVRSRARNGNLSVLPDISASLSENQLMAAIARERRSELFTEWGDRWLDLKRTGKIDEVMSIVTPQKSGANWQPHQALYPLSPTDIIRNPALVQNLGYQ